MYLIKFEEKYKLKLTDNGIGMAEYKPDNQKHSLGLELIKRLAKEIGGDLIFESITGVNPSLNAKIESNLH